MKSLHQILKISAKQAFKTLRKHGPYFCESLQVDVSVTSIFWNHINFSKYRPVQEIVYRLAIIPLVEIILQTGLIEEKREEDHLIFYKITQEISLKRFCVICRYNKKEDSHVLLSCFIEIQKK